MEPDIQWKSLSSIGYDNYKISEYGELYNAVNLRKTFGSNHTGYKRLSLSKKGEKIKQILGHVLVAKMFLDDNPADGNFSVDHIDRNKHNNHYSNLRWATRSEQRINQDRLPQVNNSYNKPITMLLDDGTEYFTFFRVRRAAEMFGIDGEIWKDYPDPNSEPMLISNFGRYLKTTTEKIGFGNTTQGAGYKYISVIISGKKRSVLMHVLVMSTFVEKIDGDNIVINHIDHNKRNNRLENLEYVTQSENMFKSYISGRKIKTGAEHYSSKKVAQYDKTGLLIKIHDSITIAGADTKTSTGNICSVCKGKRPTAGGFIWKYVD